MITKNSNINALPLILLISIVSYSVCYNASICSQFYLNGVYYTINPNYDNENIKYNDIVFNLCNSIEQYCNSTHKVVNGSLIKFYGNNLGCYGYEQYNIELLAEGNISSGIVVQYRLKENQNDSNIASVANLTYACNSNGLGCPEVESSTIFSFFKDKQLGFTIALQIIGIIFMTLGVYIYRASIVLLGACSMFLVLLAIQIPLIFSPGVPTDIISDVLILSGVCSFFAGYVFGYFPKLGIFLLGGWIGIIISLTLNNVAFYFIKSNPANLTLWIAMPVLGVLFGLLSLYITRAFTIFATSLIGAYMCLRGLSWYLGAFPNQFLLARKYHLGLTGTVTWKYYIYVVALIILTASSSALQNWLFQQKSKMANTSGDLDEQFGNMEAQVKAERSNLAQIANFKQLFKGAKGKAPKILKRRQPSEVDEFSNESPNEDQLDQVSQEKPVINKKQLSKRVIVK